MEQKAGAHVVQAFGQRKYVLLLVVSFLFMLVGAFFGIFEEVVLHNPFPRPVPLLQH